MPAKTLPWLFEERRTEISQEYIDLGKNRIKI